MSGKRALRSLTGRGKSLIRVGFGKGTSSTRAASRVKPARLQPLRLALGANDSFFRNLLRRFCVAVGFLAAALPALAAKSAKPDFGPNVLIFDPSMASQAIQKQIDAVYAVQQHNELGPQRNALFFMPGSYSVPARRLQLGLTYIRNGYSFGAWRRRTRRKLH
jgi:hypothetical protein